jgi:hypothetical protein
MAELSPYEQERERTIARNREMLASLNIPTPTVNDRVSRPHQPYPLFTGRINPDSAALQARFMVNTPVYGFVYATWDSWCAARLCPSPSLQRPFSILPG